MINSEKLVYKAKSTIQSCDDMFESGFGIFSNIKFAKNQYLLFQWFIIRLTATKRNTWIQPTYLVGS
jgi:hypothetical protein